MKIRFNGYTYWDGRTDTPNPEPTEENVQKYGNLAFNQETFNKLVNNREYSKVVDYLQHFRFDDDEKKQQQLEDMIKIYEDDGSRLSAIYSRITSKQDLAAIEVNDAIFTDKGLERLNKRDNEDEELTNHINDYIEKFEDVKNRIGGKDANYLSIKFEPEQRSFLGIDWLAKDNVLGIQTFYNISGLNKDDLLNAGVEVVEKDGYTTLNFAKSNPLANKILYNIPHPNEGFFGSWTATNEVNVSTDKSQYALSHFANPMLPLFSLKNAMSGKGDIYIKGYNYDKDGKKEYVKEFKDYIYNENDEGNAGNVDYYRILDYQKYIQELQNVKNNYFKKIGEEQLEHSIIVGPALYDDLEDILNDEDISDNEKNKLLRGNSTYNAFKNALSSIYSGTYPIYSNFANKNEDDERNYILSEVDKHKALENLKASLRTPTSVTIQSADNGKYIGTYITILPKKDENDKVVVGKTITMFIPNFMRERAQTMLNRNTTFRAARKVTDMQAYQYGYTTIDGTVIKASSSGLTKNDEQISKEEAIADINRDMAIKEVRKNMLYYSLNKEGDVVNVDEYDAGARSAAIRIAYDIYGDAIKRASNDGTKYLIYNHVYDISDIIYNNMEELDIPKPELNIIKDMQYIYDNIMDGLTYYK